jgi:AcrR family transcriptional regulator
MEIKAKILSNTEALFMRYGIKSITMDEVARHCNISKKTIYQYFPDKDALVKEVMEQHMKGDICMMEAVQSGAATALEEVLKISEFMKRDLSEIHPSVLFDLKKYHGSAYEIFERHRDSHFITSVVKNLERGIREGVYRPDIDVEIFARLRVLQVESLFDDRPFAGPGVNLQRVQLYYIDHFVRGLVTPRGLSEWEAISEHLFREIR